MPYRVVKRPAKSKGNWAIVKKTDKGKWTVAGRSETKAKAEASVRARLQGENNKYK